MSKSKSVLQIKEFDCFDASDCSNAAYPYSHRKGKGGNRFITLSDCDGGKSYVFNFTEADAQSSRKSEGDPEDDYNYEGATLEGYKAWKEWKDWQFSSEWIKNHDIKTYSQLCQRESGGGCYIPQSPQEKFEYEEKLRALPKHSCLAAKEFIEHGWDIVADRALEKYKESQILRRKEFAAEMQKRSKIFGETDWKKTLLWTSFFAAVGFFGWSLYKSVKK